MKILLFIPLVFLPIAAMGQNAAVKPLQPANIEIIDGKKFFSLANVRRHQGTSPSPAALAVINHPREDLRISPSNRAAYRPVIAPVAAPASNASAPAPGSKDTILSIFAPEEGANGAPPANSAFPSVK